MILPSPVIIASRQLPHTCRCRIIDSIIITERNRDTFHTFEFVAGRDISVPHRIIRPAIFSHYQIVRSICQVAGRGYLAIVRNCFAEYGIEINIAVRHIKSTYRWGRSFYHFSIQRDCIPTIERISVTRLQLPSRLQFCLLCAIYIGTNRLTIAGRSGSLIYDFAFIPETQRDVSICAYIEKRRKAQKN